MDENTITIFDDQGNSKEYSILFTTDNPETQKSYVFFYDENDESGNVDVAIYDEEGNLYEIEAEDAEFVEEVFDAFMAEQEEE